MITGEEISIECSGIGGCPTPKLFAFVGPNEKYDEKTDIQLERVIEATSTMNNKTEEMTTINYFKYIPEIEHHDFYVKCVSKQSASKTAENVIFTDTQDICNLPPDTYPSKVRIIYHHLYIFSFQLLPFLSAQIPGILSTYQRI